MTRSGAANGVILQRRGQLHYVQSGSVSGNYVESGPGICDDHHGPDRALAVTILRRHKALIVTAGSVIRAALSGACRITIVRMIRCGDVSVAELLRLNAGRTKGMTS